MSTFERPFCFASIRDVKTGVRFLKLLHARQEQVNLLLSSSVKITYEAMFYIKMLHCDTIKALHDMVESCEACEYITGLKTLPADHELIQAMLRYAGSSCPIPNAVLHPPDLFESAQKWLKTLGIHNDRLLDAIAFIDEASKE